MMSMNLSALKSVVYVVHALVSYRIRIVYVVHRLIKITDRTLDVVFSIIMCVSFTITLRQKPKGVTLSRRRTRQRKSVLSVNLINLWTT